MTRVDNSRMYVRERIDSTRLLTRAGEHSADIAVRLGVTKRTVVRYRARLRAERGGETR